MPNPERGIAVYDGRNLLGNVAGAEHEWRAFDARGNPLRGKFKSMKAAVAAINLSCPSPCVADARMDNGG
jgi:hypothetical protein